MAWQFVFCLPKNRIYPKAITVEEGSAHHDNEAER